MKVIMVGWHKKYLIFQFCLLIVFLHSQFLRSYKQTEILMIFMIKNLMQKTFKIFTVVFAYVITAILLASCSSKNDVLDQYTINRLEPKPPVPLVVYTTTAEANDDVTALNQALVKASIVCNKQKMRAEIMATDYHKIGYTKEQEELTKQANAKLGKSYVTTTNNDYIALLRFKCIPFQQTYLVTEANQAIGKQF